MIASNEVAVWYVESSEAFLHLLDLMKAQVLFQLKRYSEAKHVVDNIIGEDESNYNAYYIRGQINYFTNDLVRAVNDFEKVVQLSPNNVFNVEPLLMETRFKLMKQRANEALTDNDLNTALLLYSEALRIGIKTDLEIAELYIIRSSVAEKLGRFQEALDDCTKAIELNENYIEAYKKRADLARRLKMFEHCFRDYRKVIALDHTEGKRKVKDKNPHALFPRRTQN